MTTVDAPARNVNADVSAVDGSSASADEPPGASYELPLRCKHTVLSRAILRAHLISKAANDQSTAVIGERSPRDGRAVTVNGHAQPSKINVDATKRGDDEHIDDGFVPDPNNPKVAAVIRFAEQRCTFENGLSQRTGDVHRAYEAVTDPELRYGHAHFSRVLGKLYPSLSRNRESGRFWRFEGVRVAELALAA